MDAKEEIRSRINIAELIGEYLTLKPSGSGSFKAICPFHAEKSPSFHVSSEKQIWHCFGCSEGGDCFAFLMRMEGMDFSEALRTLGKKVGVEVTRFSSAESNVKDKLVRINEFAAAVYQKMLRESPGAASVRAYVEQRGIPSELVEKFGLGWAPDAWDTLSSLVEKKGIRLNEAEQAGLVQKRKSGQGYIDRFRARLMIPLRDAQGNTVAFTGRVMPSAKTTEEQGPKYMNSPETPIYHKGELLFGLDLAKQAIKREKCVVIVEGNLDVVASHKAGVEHVVGSSGTALTERQLDLLKRLTETLVFAFDQDAAGFGAARRAFPLARARGFDIRVALLSPEAGKDPDEAVQKDPEFWRRAVAHTVPAMQYLIDRALIGRDLSRVEAKKEIGELLLPELASIPNMIEREHWLQTIADLLRMDLGVLRRSVAPSSGAPSAPAVPTTRPAASVPSAPAARSRAGHAAELAFALILQEPTLQEEALPRLSEQAFPEGPLRELYRVLVPSYTHSRFPATANETYFGWVIGILQGDEAHVPLLPVLIQLGLQGEQWVAGLTPNQTRSLLAEQLQILETERRINRRKELEADIRRAEARADHDTVSKLLAEFNSLR